MKLETQRGSCETNELGCVSIRIIICYSADYHEVFPMVSGGIESEQWPEMGQLTTALCSPFIPPENITKPYVF